MCFFNILCILLPWDTPSLDIMVSVFLREEQIWIRTKKWLVKWEFCVSGTGLILKARLCQGKQGFNFPSICISLLRNRTGGYEVSYGWQNTKHMNKILAVREQRRKLVTSDQRIMGKKWRDGSSEESQKLVNLTFHSNLCPVVAVYPVLT